jgi:hypothetical protein
MQRQLSTARAAVLGSCVTSGVLNAGVVGRIASYHARTSLVSLVSPPCPVGLDAFSWHSGFARKVITADFEKTFLDDLEAREVDWLAIDLVDDRWDLLRFGDSWVTRSQDFVRAGGEALEPLACERLPRLDPGLAELWLDACGRFAAAFRARFPDLPVVLHRVVGVTSYRSGRHVQPIPPNSTGLEPAELNPLLDGYCSALERAIEPVGVIRLLPARYVADPEHEWGLGPFHYEPRYYRDAATAFGSVLRRAGWH